MALNIVTGATGFLGGVLSRKLVSNNEDVIGIGRNIQKGIALKRDGIDFLSLDLSDKSRVLNIFPNADYVFHCSALSSDWGKYKDFYNANVLATENIIGACFKNNLKKLIYVSTPSMYLDRYGKLDITEETSFAGEPLNHYTATKRMAEKLVDIAFDNGLNVATIRPRGIIGTGDEKIMPKIISKNSRGIPFIDGGKALIDVTAVENVVDSLILARDNGISGEHYNISNGEHFIFSDIINDFFNITNMTLNKRVISFDKAYTTAYVSEVVGNILGLKNLPLTRYAVCAIGKSQTFNISKAKRELGYIPKKKIKESLEEIASQLNKA